jgi:uncharacterized protein (DUF4415 family)
MSRPSTLPAGLHWPDDAEEAAIQRGIAADPENPALTAADIAAMTPAWATVPDLQEGLARRRGRQKAPTREPVILRLDRDVTMALRRSGPGWQTRAAAILKTAILGEAPQSRTLTLHEQQTPGPVPDAPSPKAARKRG